MDSRILSLGGVDVELGTHPIVGDPATLTLQQYEPRDVFPGMVPYTRRRLRDGRTRIYFRNAAGLKAFQIECDAATAAIIKPGQFVTLDFSPSV